MANKEEIQEISIRLHNSTVNDFDEIILKGVLSNESLKVSNIPASFGGGKAYLLSAESVPNWKRNFEQLTGNSKDLQVQSNRYSKAVIVFKVPYKHADYLMSISFGRGATLIDDATVVNDFGKVVTAKSIDNKDIQEAEITKITENILKGSRRVVGTRAPLSPLITEDSEFPNRVSGVSKNGKVETKYTGSNAVLKIRRLMDIHSVLDDLIFYLKTYKSNKKIADWAKKLSKVTNKNSKALLLDKTAKHILAGDDFGIAWPEEDSPSDLTIKGINSSTSRGSLSLVDTLNEYLHQTKPNASSLANKLKRSYVEGHNSQDEIVRNSVFRCLLIEFSNNGKRIILFGGDWYEVSNTFYNQVLTQVNSVPMTTLQLPQAGSAEKESDYNSRATKFLINKDNIEANEFHPKTFQSPYGTGSVEPADIITVDRHFIYVKRGTSSAVLSHLFSQGQVAGELLSQFTESKFRQFIVDNTTFGKKFLNEDVRNSQITIVFAIIKEKHNLPFFSMISFATAVKHLREMSYNVQIAWI